MNISQMASALGVSRAQVRKYAARGMPTDAEKSALAWLKKNSVGRFADKAPARGGTPPGTQGGTPGAALAPPKERGSIDAAGAGDLDGLSQAELSRRYTAARIRLTQKDEALKALREKQAQIDADLRDGKLLRGDDEFLKNFERAVTLRTKLMALPAEWAIQLAAMSDPALVADFTRKRIRAALIDYCAAFGVRGEEAPAGHPTEGRAP